MPINSLSGTLSTAVYLTAMLLLLVVVMVPAKTAYDDASRRAAQELASGVAYQIDSLTPGMNSIIKISSMPGTSIAVSFTGSELTATVNGISASSLVLWDVTSPVLEGGVEYPATLDGDMVNIA